MRLIDADALIETLMNIEFKYDVGYPKEKRTFAEKAKDIGTMCAMLVADQIVNAPTIDAVSVVRCKDCKYFNEHTAEEKERCKFTFDGMCRYWKYHSTDYSWFCSQGERREVTE